MPRPAEFPLRAERLFVAQAFELLLLPGQTLTLQLQAFALHGQAFVLQHLFAVMVETRPLRLSVRRIASVVIRIRVRRGIKITFPGAAGQGQGRQQQASGDCRLQPGHDAQYLLFASCHSHVSACILSVGGSCFSCSFSLRLFSFRFSSRRRSSASRSLIARLSNQRMPSSRLVVRRLLKRRFQLSFAMSMPTPGEQHCACAVQPSTGNLQVKGVCTSQLGYQGSCGGFNFLLVHVLFAAETMWTDREYDLKIL